jgi:hypothetical protein
VGIVTVRNNDGRDASVNRTKEQKVGNKRSIAPSLCSYAETMHISTKHVTTDSRNTYTSSTPNPMSNVFLSHKLDALPSQPQAAPYPPLTAQVTVMTLDAFISSVKSAKTKMLAINPLRKLTKTKRTAIYETSSASTAHPALPQPIEALILQSWDSYDWQKSSESLTDWINGRWCKTGYSVSKEVVCFTLRLNGRDARLGLQDHLCGAFFRGERRSCLIDLRRC